MYNENSTDGWKLYITPKDSQDYLYIYQTKTLITVENFYFLPYNHIIHKVNYVSDIYNEAQRELSFTDITVDNTYVKVVATEDGVVLKEALAYN